MKTVAHTDPDFAATVAALGTRGAFSDQVDREVAAILGEVKRDGDAAVCRFAHKFDHATLTPETFRVSRAELAAAGAALSDTARHALELVFGQLTVFAQQRRPQDWRFTPRPGVSLGERFVPLTRVAAYIPGGAAPLVSTTLHTLALARAAGVPELVLSSPPGKDGKVHPAILFAAQLAGATEVYRLGGVYAIGALAYGTASVRRVEKIVGPGNAYVTAAKRQVYGHVGLDLVAGPSEVAIIADETAKAEYLAADLLAQAEHGSGAEQALLLTTHAPLLAGVRAELERQATSAARVACVRRVLDQGVVLLHVRDLDQAVELANQFAPEHLEIHTADPEAVAARITAAGALFLGPWTPEPVGDFTAGPSHVLPTGGAARFCSGLTVEHFYRRMSVVSYERAALLREAWALGEFARLEQLEAHGRSVACRFGKG